MSERKKTIGKNDYTLALPPVRQAMTICTKVTIMAGPVVLSTQTDTDKGGIHEFATAMAAMEPEQVDALFMEAANISKLACKGAILSDDLAFSQHFNDCRNEVYPVMMWTLWECVRDFLPQAPVEAFIQAMRGSIGKAFQSQMDGTPTTG